MHFWFKQAKMPGKITRLLTAHGPDALATSIPTHVAPPPLVPDDPRYTPYNKPSAVDHWIREVRYHNFSQLRNLRFNPFLGDEAEVISEQQLLP